MDPELFPPMNLMASLTSDKNDSQMVLAVRGSLSVSLVVPSFLFHRTRGLVSSQ